MQNRIQSAAMLALLSRAVPEIKPVTEADKPVRMKTGVTPRQILAAFDVYLDGERQDGCCVEADREAGYVVRYVRSKRTRKFVRKDGIGEFITERVEGKVEFRLKGVYTP